MSRISLSVSADGMGAKLRLEGFNPVEWRGEWAAPGSLRSWLVAQGIAAECIREVVLVWIGETLAGVTPKSLDKDLESVQGVEVAQGLPPVHEEPAGLAFQRSYLSNAEAIADLRKRVDSLGLESVQASIDGDYRVAAGETVMSFQAAVPGRAGLDVYGHPIPFLPCRDRVPRHGHSLRLKDRRLISLCEGVLILEEGTLKVLGADTLPTCHVAVAEDAMSATLVLGGSSLNDWDVTLEMVQAALREEGVLCMVPETEILAALGRFNRDHIPETLVVAQGRPPGSGEAGRLELLVDPEPEVPKPGADGSIDFKHFSFFRTVAAGEKLARLLPPAPGTPGMNVHGEVLPAPPEEAFSRNLGRNTRLVGADPAFVEAATPGRLAIHGGVPEVVEVLDVSGDVSLKTGNISFPGAVRVAGDVHGKMAIEAAGDVDVLGTVEDSMIRSDGAIVIRGGVSGTGQGIVKSRLSSVTLGYLHNQRIESHSHIMVFNEIMNSQLLARKSISMRNGRYSAMGGYLLAGETMDLFNVGSETGIKTILEVGKDFEVEAEIAAKAAMLQARLADGEFLAIMDEQLDRILKLRRGQADEELLLQKRTQGAMEILARRIETLKKELGELARRLYHPGPCVIHIRGTVHPGTVLKYRDQVTVIAEPVTNRIWNFKHRAPGSSPNGR